MEWLSEQPCLQTARLELRALQLEDATALGELAGAAEVAATTMLIPHPYPEGAAEEFILGQEAAWVESRGATFGIFEKATGRLCGCAGVGCDRAHLLAEMGYWIGVPYWGRGFATEAAARLLAFGFAYFCLNRIEARHFASNPASGRVLEKIGMRREGIRRQAIFKEGRGFEDVVDYGLLIREWRQQVVRGSAGEA